MKDEAGEIAVAALAVMRLNEYLVDHRSNFIEWRFINVAPPDQHLHQPLWRAEAWHGAYGSEEDCELIGVAQSHQKKYAKNMAAMEAWRVLTSRTPKETSRRTR